MAYLEWIVLHNWKYNNRNKEGTDRNVRMVHSALQLWVGWKIFTDIKQHTLTFRDVVLHMAVKNKLRGQSHKYWGTGKNEGTLIQERRDVVIGNIELHGNLLKTVM